MTLLPLKKTGEEALKPFGYDLFAEFPSSFEPLTNVPVPLRSVPSPMPADGCEAGTTEWIPTVAFATFSSRYNVAFKTALRKNSRPGFWPPRKTAYGKI